MLSYETKSKLANFFSTLLEGERQLELMRQILCEHREFEPHAAFSRIDRLRRGFLTATDINRFLSDNSINHTEIDCAAYVRRYSGKEGEHVSYSEFVKSVLTAEDSKLRATTTQRKAYEVDYGEFLAPEVEYTLSRIIDREITFYKGIDYEKYSLAKRYDYSHADAFAAVDRFSSGRIDFDNLKAFFRDLAQFPTNEELNAILRRMDKDDDGILKYGEFVEALEPLDSGLNLERGYKGIKNRVTTSMYYEATPQRRTASATKTQTQTPEKEVMADKYTEPYQSKISPFKQTTIPGRAIAHSPAQTYTPNRKQFTTQVVGEEIPAEKASKNFSEEKSMPTPSTADKTSLAKQSRPMQGEGEYSGAKEVRKTLDYGDSKSGLDMDRLVYTLKQFIALDKELEGAKQELALRIDFNLLDFFRVFDVEGKGAITFGEFAEGFKKFGVLPHKDEFYLAAIKYDRDNDGKIK